MPVEFAPPALRATCPDLSLFRACMAAHVVLGLCRSARAEDNDPFSQ